MTTARRIQSLIAPRQLTAQELEDGLRRIGQSAGLVEVRVPVPILPLMIGMLQGAVECPDISHQKRAGLYAILFDVKAILSGLVPGHVESPPPCPRNAWTPCVKCVTADRARSPTATLSALNSPPEMSNPVLRIVDRCSSNWDMSTLWVSR